MKNKTYSIGAKFNNGIDNYILAQVLPCKVTLINITNGNRCSDPLIRVKQVFKIAFEEMKEIVGYDYHLFKEGWI